MMKKLFALFLAIALCLSFAACSSGEPEGPVETEPVATSIEGAWSCVDAKMIDNGEEFGADMLTEMLGVEVKDMFTLTAYGDGSGEMVLFGEDTAAIAWTEKDGGYVISPADGEAAAEGETIFAKLEEGQLIVTISSSYDADGTEVVSEMIYTLEYAGKVSLLLADWDLQITEDQIREMNNFMAQGWFVVAEGYLYGSFGGTDFGQGTFSMAKINGASLDNASAIEADAMATYLTEHDGYVYGILNNDRIFKIKAGETEMEVLFEGYCDYAQIANDKIYYCDENYRFCSMDLNGKNTEVVLDKEVYFPYILPNNVAIYQHDADNESLYFYDLADGEDVKLCDGPAYHPVLCGDYVYYQSADGEVAIYQLCRVNVMSAQTECDNYDHEDLGFYIENGNLYYTLGGLPGLSLDEWDQFGDQGFSGFVYIPRYSNGEVRLYSASNGECYITTDAFNSREDAQSIGYMYVAQ
ncbi:MAG: DUF5050 domain-containing protein [Firmicutes bacterium]|nr:DUF5050 domain-containing protein [Bacillota bacterium]